MKVLGIEHVAVAVDDVDEPVRVFSQLLGIGDHSMEEVPDQQVVAHIFDTGSGKVELLSATSADAPIARFLEKRGPGLHHIAFLVDDLAAWLEHLQAEGVELIDRVPRPGAEGHLIAFLHPRSTAGVLVELCQKP